METIFKKFATLKLVTLILNHFAGKIKFYNCIAGEIHYFFKSYAQNDYF